ncbi:hypothetical protein L1987_67596 [Smallanthus sonchifolius]|uniref:Uncharacterized protein n=1 Tax=Smallanthus sonchifolius TaxID=185202 RepID=A0ACB9B3D9_9ASTR|nr:hypothetical protein L1987_67596 [Smallanthus sonchifolius]
MPEAPRKTKIPTSHGYGGQFTNCTRKGSTSIKDVLTGDRGMDKAIKKTLVLDDKWSGFEILHGRYGIAGLPTGGLKYLGGMNFLLSYKTKEQVVMARDEFMGRGEDFESVMIWDGQKLAFERIAWVKVQGVPVQVLSNEVINDAANLFGKVVHKAQHATDDADVSYYYVGLADAGDWEPDFLRDGKKDTHASTEEEDRTEPGSQVATNASPEIGQDDGIVSPEKDMEGINSMGNLESNNDRDLNVDCQFFNLEEFPLS